VLVEVRQTSNRSDQIHALIEHGNGSRAETRLVGAKCIEVHAAHHQQTGNGSDEAKPHTDDNRDGTQNENNDSNDDYDYDDKE
jgi:hypothetical protein